MKILNKSKISILSGISLLVLSACDQGAMTVSEYKESPEKIAAVLEKCDENPKDHLTEDRCINAKVAKTELKEKNQGGQYLSLEEWGDPLKSDK